MWNVTKAVDFFGQQTGRKTQREKQEDPNIHWGVKPQHRERHHSVYKGLGHSYNKKLNPNIT